MSDGLNLVPVILVTLSTARNGMSQERLFVKVAEEHPDYKFSWRQFNLTLNALQTEGFIYKGKNLRWYDGCERTF
jgi:hypothetical protein